MTLHSKFIFILKKIYCIQEFLVASSKTAPFPSVMKARPITYSTLSSNKILLIFPTSQSVPYPFLIISFCKIFMDMRSSAFFPGLGRMHSDTCVYQKIFQLYVLAVLTMPRPAPNQSSAREDDYCLKETSPNLGGGRLSRGDKLTTAFDLVEQMHYLYVRVVKAKELPGKDGSESCDPYVEVKVGNFKGFTKHIEKKSNPVWSQVFAFSKDRLQSSFIEVSVKDKNGGKDDFMGVVLFDLHDVPRRVPPDTQDLVPSDRTRNEVYVKAALGTIVLRTRFPQTRTINPFWNEDLMFVASEPFEEPLVLSVENRVVANKEETLGKCMISLQDVERRLENRPVSAKWFNLEKMSGEQKEVKFSSRIHLRICLDGGYHVLDEATHFSTDFRPTMKHLWKPSTGVLELGIINAHDLLLKEKKGGRRNTDAYCVAKYARLGRAEPPLRKEVVEYMLDVGSNMFSMRRSKANYYRIIEVISDLKMALKWFDEICLWKNPFTTLSLPDTVFPDELEEEFDSFPTSLQAEILKIRYDRVRSVASRIQTLMGDLATQGERLQALLSWRDPRATALCMIFCLTAGTLFLFIPFRVFAVLVVLYVLRHPRLRHRMPSVPLSFFKRLPARTDSMF
ncbi:unnamed protein product, partial [Vitis vinifera]